MKKLLLSVICVLAIVFAGCEPNAPATSSKVETGAASDITTTSAVLHGEVNVDISQYNDVEFGMIVSVSLEDLNNRDGKMYKAKVLMGKEFKLELTKLSPATEYYYCAWLFLNDTQYEFGTIKDFETEALSSSKYVAKPFSVSSSKQVYFSPGNLQYHPANDKWRFAANQTDYIGNPNSNISSTYNGWLDLFGWSTTATNFSVSTSTSSSDYSGSFIDWGTNPIGNDAPNTWRTLSKDEWDYLRYGRPNASSLCGIAQVNGVNGLIFLPDNWICPAGVTFKSGFHSNSGSENYAAYQTFTAEQWSKLEAAGAVFLPAAGFRCGSDVSDVQGSGYCWSTTEYDSDYAYVLYFGSGEAGMGGSDRYGGFSVRLVKDVEGETTEPEIPEEDEEPEEKPASGVFSVSATKQVTFSPGNLQYTRSTDTWSFAKNQYDYIGTDNVTGGSVSSDQYGEDKSGTALADKVDLFGWSTNTTNFGVSTSTDYDDYYGSFVDWGTNKIGNDAPNTWRTLSYDEWSYLRYNRTNANDLVGVAQVNGVNGLIFLPDNWTYPAGVTFKSGFHSEYSVEACGQYQTFSADQWSKLESAGAVFLPASGARYGSIVDYVQYGGYYWSAPEYDGYDAGCLYFGSGDAGMDYIGRYNGLGVRLVKDLQ